MSFWTFLMVGYSCANNEVDHHTIFVPVMRNPTAQVLAIFERREPFSEQKLGHGR